MVILESGLPQSGKFKVREKSWNFDFGQGKWTFLILIHFTRYFGQNNKNSQTRAVSNTSIDVVCQLLLWTAISMISGVGCHISVIWSGKVLEFGRPQNVANLRMVIYHVFMPVSV
jgi:hypothetical protein